MRDVLTLANSAPEMGRMLAGIDMRRPRKRVLDEETGEQRPHRLPGAAHGHAGLDCDAKARRHDGHEDPLPAGKRVFCSEGKPPDGRLPSILLQITGNGGTHSLG